MKTLQTIVAILFFTYAGFMVGYFIKNKPPVQVPAVAVVPSKPITDWNKFYEAVKNDKGVRLAVGVAPLHPRANHYDLYLVDGDEWLKIGWAGMRGCGREMDVYFSYFSLDRLERELVKVPSDAARFVAVGPGGVVVKDFRIEYPEDD